MTQSSDMERVLYQNSRNLAMAFQFSGQVYPNLLKQRSLLLLRALENTYFQVPSTKTICMITINDDACQLVDKKLLSELGPDVEVSRTSLLAATAQIIAEAFAKSHCESPEEDPQRLVADILKDVIDKLVKLRLKSVA